MKWWEKAAVNHGAVWHGREWMMPDRTPIECESDWIEYKKEFDRKEEEYESRINGFCGR